jgi:D-glycero-D-manno-heptose 1,7-bisphosphate phosphatase
MLIILDRDGVINEDSPDFIKSPAEWLAIPGSLEAIAQMNRAGHRVVVASNQSGVARGYFSVAGLLSIHHKMQNEAAKAGAHFDGIYFCPHRSEDCCPCRKPKPGMLLQIARDFNADLGTEGLFIGDSLRDIQAAQAAHCPAALVKTGKGAQTFAKGEGLNNVAVYESLAAFTT